MAHVPFRHRRRAAAVACVAGLLLPVAASAAGLSARAARCATDRSAAGCAALESWCRDDRFVEADPASCKFAFESTAAAPDNTKLRADCEAKTADGVCAVLLEACDGDLPSGLRGLCSDARRWSKPPPASTRSSAPTVTRESPSRSRYDDDDDDDRFETRRGSSPVATRLGLGGWSTSSDGLLAGVDLGLRLAIAGGLGLDVFASAAAPIDFGGVYVRGQGRLNYGFNLGGLNLGLGVGAGWDGSVMGTTPRAPGALWAVAGAELSMGLGFCLELCDLDDVSATLGVAAEARYVLDDSPRSRVNRLADFDDTLYEVFLTIPMPMSPRISLRTANQFTTAEWTGLFLTLRL